MTNIPKYPVRNEGADVKTFKAELAGSGADLASFAAGAWLTGLVAYLLACLHGANVSSAAKGGTSEQWAALLYPIFSFWIWGPLVLLALILAIVAKARKSPRQWLATTVVMLSAAFPILAFLVLAIGSFIAWLAAA
jgi:small-conductance mechanosensitive channel